MPGRNWQLALRRISGAIFTKLIFINLCGGGVDVMVAEESVDHVLILAQGMRHDAQTNL